MGKITKGIPPLRIPKIRKKAQEKEDEIKIKLYEANSYWNDWRFQFHWNNLEWVDPRSQIKREKYSSVYSKKFYINKVDKTSHWFGHLKLK